MKNRFYRQYFKRSFDIIFSLIFICLGFPLFIILIILQLLFNGFPIFFFQKRIGKNDVPFVLIKLRSMRLTKRKNDNDISRITWFGKFLRLTSLDEVPSFLNVLLGSMSIVGPRALPIEYLTYLKRNHPYRSTVKPGITGLAQIKGRNKLSWSDKFMYDNLYINDVRFFLDFKIIFLTLFVIFRFKEVNKSSTEITERLDLNE